MRYLYLVLFSLILLAGIVIGTQYEEIPPEKGPDPSGLRFIENKGQWEKEIQYAVQLNGGNILFGKTGIAYIFTQEPEHQHPHVGHQHEVDTILNGHIIKVLFKGANEKVRLVPSVKYPEYHNYFIGNDPSKWAGGVGMYGYLTYRDLYPGIDLRVYGDGDKMKYDFVVAPGADPSLIELLYEGADRLQIKSGELVVHTSVRTMKEAPPYAYQEDINGKRSEVPSAYSLRANKVSYRLPNGYDRTKALIIDPTLEFSTYTGSRADNWGFTATYDDTGNVYAGGIVYVSMPTSSTVFPVTSGAFQRSFRGDDRDAVLVKYNATGTTMMYATFLGGSGQDQPHSLVVNDQGELFAFGRTSSNNFPTTLSGYDRTYNGGYDLFVVKFSPDGRQLRSGTYVGSTGDDGENGRDFTLVGANGFGPLQYNYGDDSRGEIILDPQGNCYVASCTDNGGFPITANAFQRNFGGGGQDGVVFKLTANLSILEWSSFLGGNRVDAAYGLQLDSVNNCYVTGGTQSANFTTTNGAYRTNYQGGLADGFIVKIRSNGSQLIASTYLGTAAYDQSYFVQLDKNENVYVTGQTDGTTYPVQNATYVDRGARQFITKFDNNLTRIIYSTTFGNPNSTDPDISPTAFLVDRCENVYVAGWGGVTNNGYGNLTSSTRNMRTTADAISRSTDGSDFYTFVMERDARGILYGTFLGGNNSLSGDHVDGGTSRFDKEGIIYHAVCAGCGGNSSFPTTPGVVSRTNNSSNCNMLAFKIRLDLAGIKADFTPLDDQGRPLITTGCVPFQVRFDNTSIREPGTTFQWDFADGSTGSVQFEPTHTFLQAGTYQVRLIITDSSTCNITDTAFRTITVFPPPATNAGPDEIICEGDTIGLNGTGAGAISYAWSPSGLLSNPNVPNPLAFPPGASGATPFILTVTDTNGCQARDTMRVSIDNSLEVTARPDTLICNGVTVQLGATSTNGIQYTWRNDPTISNTGIVNPLATPDTSKWYYVTAINSRGCEEEDSVFIEIFEVFTLEDTFLCLGDTIFMRTRNGASFSWSPPTALSNPNVASPQAYPTSDIIYQVTAISQDGCTSTKEVAVDVRELPVAEAGPNDTTCLGDTVLLSGAGGVTFQWTPVDGLIDPNNGTTFAAPTLTTTYFLTVRDSVGCADTDSLTILINSLPTIDAGEDVTICEGEVTVLNASGGIAYLWDADTTLSDITIPDPLAFPIVTTDYFVNGQDENGCESEDTVTVNVIPRPRTQIDGTNNLCNGGQIDLFATGGDFIVWSTGDTAPSISLVPVDPIWIYATAFTGECRGFTDSVLVSDTFKFPKADFLTDPLIGFAPLGVKFTNTSTGAVRYLWDFGTGVPPDTARNPDYVFPSAGEYTVTLIAFTGSECSDTIQKVVTVENIFLHVPSGFTPNGDNMNEAFLVKYYGILSLNVRVYSRWGIKIFESDDKDFQWDGRYKNEAVPEGVYVYVIEALGENGIVYNRSGTVTLIR
ncbi:MAG: PKD domain-containing protein [Bacteroidota bacterium]